MGMLLQAVVVGVMVAAVEGLSMGNVTALTGTWTSKSGGVVTGPGFYNPVGDIFLEPNLTGRSYSFTDNGWYEEALYFTVSNPTTPACPQAFMQWQHGQYSFNSNGSLTLVPVALDGRQLQSAPCTSATSVYTRYNQTELFSEWQIVVDGYSGRYRLNLFQFDGTPVNPMYLTYLPPQMLPTQTLHPTAVAQSTSSSTAAAQRRRKRDAVIEKALHATNDGESIWWVGMGLVVFGSISYWFTSRH